MADADREIEQIRNLADPDARGKRVRALRVKYHPDKNLPALRDVFDALSKHINAQTDALV